MKSTTMKQIGELAIAIAVIAVVVFLTVRMIGLGGQRSYFLFPEPGDWYLETNGRDYRWVGMDSTGTWITGDYTDCDSWRVARHAKQHAPIGPWR